MTAEMQPRCFVCAECGKLFKRKDVLARHIKLVHQNSVQFPCPMCGLEYKTKFALKRHIQTNYSTVLPFKCETCNDKFRLQAHLNRHIRVTHPHLRLFTCAQCYNTTFKVKIDLERHIKRMHSGSTVTSRSKRLICVLCREAFARKSLILLHYEECHATTLDSGSLQFASLSEFHEWKNSVEKETVCQFIRMRQDRMKHETTTVFSCHRSGSYIPKSTGKVRRLKLQGSKKLNGFCPAEMAVRENRTNGTCFVTYIKTHIGHVIADEAELAHVYLTAEERANIARQIAAGMSYEQITNALCEDGNVESDKLRLLSNHDLHNIAASYNLKLVRREKVGLQTKSSSSAAAAAANVEEFISRYTDSILYYKKKGVQDDSFPHLKNEDIVLVIMTPTQRAALQKFGHNVIAIDRAYDMEENGDHFLLQTLLVVDDYLEGFACAFAISSREDHEMTNVFLRCIRENSDNSIRPSCLITGMDESYYESWLNIMSPPRHRLYCSWHVNRAWKRSLHTITNKETCRRVKLKLEDLSNEPDEHEFLTKIEHFFQLEDERTESFFEYFRDRCVANARLWAHCYRLNVDSNANVYMESFHNVLKQLHGEGRKITNLVDGLNVLHQYLRQKERMLKIKEIRGRISAKLKTLRRRHDLMLETFESSIQRIEKSETDDYWLVFSCALAATGNQEGVVEIFYVQCVNETHCPFSLGCKLVCEKCNVCAHQYKCSCPDSSIKNNMCRHVHAVCSHVKNSSPVSTVSPLRQQQPPLLTSPNSSFALDPNSTCTMFPLVVRQDAAPLPAHCSITTRDTTSDPDIEPFTFGVDDVHFSDTLNVSPSIDVGTDEFKTKKSKLKLALLSAASALDMASNEEELDVMKQLIVNPMFSSTSTNDSDLIELYSPEST